MSMAAKTAKLEVALSKYNPVSDMFGGFLYFGGTRRTVPWGHCTKITDFQRGLSNDIKEYQKLNCDINDDDGPGTGAVNERSLDFATLPIVKPGFVLPRVDMPQTPNIIPIIPFPIILLPLLF